jgi:hypothetical protein
MFKSFFFKRSLYFFNFLAIDVQRIYSYIINLRLYNQFFFMLIFVSLVHNS